MKKAQALKFWKELSNSTNAKEVISAFTNKRGYDGKRTLERYVQAAKGFEEGLSARAIAEKTGWSADFIEKIHAWWKEVFPSESGPVTQELATMVALGPTVATPVEIAVPAATPAAQELPYLPVLLREDIIPRLCTVYGIRQTEEVSCRVGGKELHVRKGIVLARGTEVSVAFDWEKGVWREE